MSFLNFVLADDFISVLSDGQLTKGNISIRDDYQKFYVHPNKFIFGSTGHFDVGADIINELKHAPFLTYSGAKSFICGIAEKYYGLTDELGQKAKFTLLLAGFSGSKSKATTLFVNGDQYNKQDLYSTSSISSNPDDIDFDGTKIVLEHLTLINGKLDKNMVLAAQKLALEEVAKESNEVNHHAFHEFLLR